MSKSWLRTQHQPQGMGPLFDITARRHKGNEQSTAAFHVIKDKITEKQAKVLEVIRWFSSGNCQGVTAEQIADELQTTVNAISGRVSELKRDGKIYKSGTRKTRSGCSAAILKAFA